jgi:signal peptidase II
MTLRKAYLLIFILLLVDQVSNLYKTNFILGEEVEVFNWFKVLFIENEGMALGVQILGRTVNYFNSFLESVGIGYWLWDSKKKKSSDYLIVAISLILVGALGT